MPAIQRINAVFLYVKNMSEMRKFYESVLGFHPPVINTDLWVEYELPGAHLAFHQGDARILEEQKPLTNTMKFSLQVEGLEELCKILQEKNVKIAFGPRKDFGSLLAEIQDIEGNPIRLVEKLPS